MSARADLSWPAAFSFSSIGRHRTTTFTLSAFEGSGFGGCYKRQRRRIDQIHSGPCHQPLLMMTTKIITTTNILSTLSLTEAQKNNLLYRITPSPRGF